jgi:hypothetical protein
MPQRYDYAAGNYRVTCTSCDRVARTDNPWSRDAIDTDGTAVVDIFAWHSGHSRWYTRCRECDRRIRAARRRSEGPRVPGTRRGGSTPLGIGRKFGVEFECAFPTTISDYEIADAMRAAGVSVVTRIADRNPGDWYVKGDPSISVPGMYGREIVSPALEGEDGEEQVRKVARVFNQLGAKVNSTCGTHIHHDANDLSVDAIKRVARSWFNNQDLISGLVSASRRVGGSTYCQPLTDWDVQRIENVRNLRGMKSVQVDRYRSLNMRAYGKFGTLEIRQHQGTLSAEKVISWVRLGQAIIDQAKASEFAVAGHSRLRDLFSSLSSNLDETAATFLLGRAVQFNVVTV